MKKILKLILENKIKIINILFLLCIFFYVSLSSYQTFFKPTDIIVEENRYANKIKSFSYEKYMDGSFQTEMENALLDQVIMSSKLKKLNTYSDIYAIKSLIELTADKTVDKYYYIKGRAVFGKNILVYVPYKFDDCKTSLTNKIKSLNGLMEKYPQVEYYFYYIEKDTDINFENNEKLLAYEYLKENLNTSNIAKFEINNFEEYKEYFYETDHHWNYKGSYKAYKEILDLLNLEDPKIPEEEICFDGKFFGSKSKHLSNVYYETLCVYKFDYENIETYVNGKKRQYGKEEEYYRGEYSEPDYKFYGSNEGEVIFNTNDETKDNILIVGESFSYAILKLLSEKYNKTHFVDLRYYKNFMKKDFDYSDYIKENEIDKVFFVGNINYWLFKEFEIID